MNLKAIDAAVYAALSADLVAGAGTLQTLGATGVFNAVAPSGQAFPYVMFHRQEPGHGRQRFKAGKRLWQAVYLVKAVDRGANGDRADDLDTRCDERLNEHPERLVAAGVNISMILREGSVAFEEEDGNEILWHRGGLYRVWMEQV